MYIISPVSVRRWNVGENVNFLPIKAFYGIFLIKEERYVYYECKITTEVYLRAFCYIM